MTDTRDIRSYAAAWRERFTREKQELTREQEAVRGRANECARVLVSTFEAERVWLVGSLVRDGAWRSRSDVDLVVEGLPPHRYWEALDSISEIACLPVDLVRTEESPSHAELARTRGRLLHERESIPASSG